MELKAETYSQCLGPVRKLCANIIWTHKIHEKQTDIYTWINRLFTILSLGVTALAGCGIFSTFHSENYLIKVGSLGLTAVSLFVTLYLKTANYSARIEKEHVTSQEFLELRESSQNLLSNTLQETASVQEIQDSINKLSNDYLEKCRNSPRTTNFAVWLADRALKSNHESSYEEDEIDKLLPAYLRRKMQ